MDPRHLFINGRFERAHSDETIDVLDPSTRERLATVPDSDRHGRRSRRLGGEVGIRRSVARRVGARARPDPDAHRRRHPRSRADELAELETRNSGKPIVEAESDIEDAATCFEYYAGLASTIHGEVLPVQDGALVLALREPVGVAAQIIPWNYPLVMAAWKLAPAVCAGCTVVLKPAEETPLSALELATRSRRQAFRQA